SVAWKDVAPPLRRAEFGNNGCQKTLGAGEKCQRNCGVWCRKDPYFAGSMLVPQRRKRVHCPGHGATPLGGEVGPRDIPDSATSTSIPHRRHAQWRQPKRATRDQRSAPAPRRDRARGNAYYAFRAAKPWTKGMAKILPGKLNLLHRKREGEALLFLEALLQ